MSQSFEQFFKVNCEKHNWEPFVCCCVREVGGGGAGRGGGRGCRTSALTMKHLEMWHHLFGVFAMKTQNSETAIDNSEFQQDAPTASVSVNHSDPQEP